MVAHDVTDLSTSELGRSGYAHDAALTVAGSGIVAPSNGTDVACGGSDGHQFLDWEVVGFAHLHALKFLLDESPFVDLFFHFL